MTVRLGLTLAVGVLAFATSVSATCPPVHRSQAVVRAFQRAHPCPSTGRRTGACPGWVRDHITALACGGKDIVSNIQWQTYRDARAKDKWERKSCPVCHMDKEI